MDVKNFSIFVLDDEPAILFTIKNYFSNYNIVTFSDPELALKEIQNKKYDILIVDYKMPNMSGLEFLVEVRKLNCFRTKILLTGFANKNLLEESINKGLVDRILEKPIEMKVLKNIIDELILEFKKTEEKENEIIYLKKKYEELINEFHSSKNKIIGINKGLKNIFEQTQSIAKHSVNVLITGETGTGKELIAKAIHNLSPRKNNAFIKINCSAIPDNLLESELFGFKKGAFTDAKNDKIGKMELADGGTLFLDEIGDLKMDLQVKLLRAIQEKEIERLGSNDVVKVDFRLIAATNVDLKKALDRNKFREDLYYRINTFPIILPPLRDRKEDIDDLVAYFIEKGCIEIGVKKIGIDSKSINLLKSYSWPGNIRELENAITRAIMLSIDKNEITEDCFDFLFERNKNKKNYYEAIRTIRDEIIRNKVNMKNIEDDLLKSVLSYYNNNILHAVDKTGISKNKFYRRIER